MGDKGCLLSAELHADATQNTCRLFWQMAQQKQSLCCAGGMTEGKAKAKRGRPPKVREDKAAAEPEVGNGEAAAKKLKL